MTVLVAVLLAVLGLVLALLLVPFQARGRAAVNDSSPTASARLQWAWGLLSLDFSPRGGAVLRVAGLRVWRFSRGGPGEKEEAGDEEEAEKKRKKPGLAQLRAALRNRPALVRMVLRLGRALRLRLRVSGVVGTDDPANTALLAMLLRALEEVPGVKLDLRCDWAEEELDVEVEGSARVWLAHLLCLAVALLLVRENRVALRAVA